MNEKTIEKKVCDYAKAQGCLVYKFTSPSNRGVPDRMILAPEGHLLFIEFKQPGGRLSALQKYHIEMIGSMGFSVEVVDDVVCGKALIDAWRDAV